MPTYLSPGVYVEEISSGSAPIAGLGTSVAGFIGIFTPSDSASGSQYYINKSSDELSDKERENGDPPRYKLKNYPVQTKKTSVTLKSNPSELLFGYFELKNDDTAQTSTIEFTSAPPQGCQIKVNNDDLEETGDGKIKEFKLKNYSAKTNGTTVALKWAIPESGFELQKNETGKISQIKFTSAPPKETTIKISYKVALSSGDTTTTEDDQTGDSTTKEFELSKYPDVTPSVEVDDSVLQSGFTVKEKKIVFTQSFSVGQKIKIKYSVTSISDDIEEDEIEVTEKDKNKQEFELSKYPDVTPSVTLTLTSSVTAMKEDENYSLENDITGKKSIIKFISTSPPSKGDKITIDYFLGTSVSSSEIKLITNFTEFKQYFGDFTKDNPEQNIFAHAVYGFFRNGGTRAYVTWVSGANGVDGILTDFEAIDEISIVVAPGQTDANIIGKIKDHAVKMGDRIAILDSVPNTDLGSQTTPSVPNFTSDYAAFYFPWIQVYDSATETNIFVPPSGHIAGVYAKVDGERGVHKAPANVPLLGALDLKYNLSKAKQDGLNPQGVNVIRKLNGNILVWGARTLGGDTNGEFKYVNVRRHFCYLKDSIDKGTQWVVFEPNTPELWAKIRRNISAFLTLEWRKGALFGTTPQEAFYVKCDAENNPPALRDLGQVVIEIGVAAVKPAEFVIFRLSQWAGSKE